MKPAPKPVYRIHRTDHSRTCPFAVIDPDGHEVRIDATPERCSAWAFREHGEGIEVRHEYLESAP